MFNKKMCKMKYVWALAVNFRRLLLAIDHLALFVGWLLPVNSLRDPSREVGWGLKAK